MLSRLFRWKSSKPTEIVPNTTATSAAEIPWTNLARSVRFQQICMEPKKQTEPNLDQCMSLDNQAIVPELMASRRDLSAQWTAILGMSLQHWGRQTIAFSLSLNNQRLTAGGITEETEKIVQDLLKQVDALSIPEDQKPSAFVRRVIETCSLMLP